MVKYHVLIEPDEEGWFVAEVAELPGCYTQAKTKSEVLIRVKEGILGYLAVMCEAHEELPKEKFVELTAVEV